MTTNVEKITKTILEVAELNRDQSFTFGAFNQAVASRLGIDKPTLLLQVATKACVATGHLDGTFTPSGQVNRIKYKNPNEQKGSDGTELIPKADLERVVREFRTKEAQTKKEHEDICNGFHARIAELLEQKSRERIVKVVIETPGKKKPREITETFHSVFEEVVLLAKARENIFLYGPTGSGKTFIGAQLAKVLDLPFYFVSGSRGMSESKLTGRVLPTGKNGAWEYSPSEFVKAYENGGVYLLDEIDALDDNVLLILNTALSNDRFAVPERKGSEYVTRHPDFICISAANTLGMGADRQYSGRNKLDAATMDRFAIGKLLVDYDPQLEEQICPDDVLRDRLTSFRKAIEANRLERAMSTRFLEKAYKMKQLGWTQERIEKAYFTGWREDEMNKVLAMVGRLEQPKPSVKPTPSEVRSVPKSDESPITMKDIRHTYETDSKVKAVKMYRELHKCDLRTALENVAAHANAEGWKTPAEA